MEEIKDYQEIMRKLLKDNSIENKIKLFNDISHDCEQIFNLNNSSDKQDFIHLYGKQSFDYHYKISPYWLGGDNFYDNENYKSASRMVKILSITESNIDKILFNIIDSDIDKEDLNNDFIEQYFHIDYFCEIFNIKVIDNPIETLKQIKEWVESSHAYLSSSKPYSQGYKDGITQAKDIISNIIKNNTQMSSERE
jgi:hypothetical protein